MRSNEDFVATKGASSCFMLPAMFESEMKRRTAFSKLQSVYFSLGVSSSFSFEQQPFPIAAVRTIFRQCCSLCDTVQRSVGSMDLFRQQYATHFQVMLCRRHQARAESRTHWLRVNRCIVVSEFQRSLSEFIQDFCDVVHTRC